MLLINGKILTVTGEIIQDGYVLIKDQKIIDLGCMSELPNSSACDVLDVKGNYILPGFVDGHSHAGIMEDGVGIEGKDHNESSDPITPHLKASDGIYFNDIALKEAYENGVTTVAVGPGSSNVIGGQFAAIKTYGDCIESMLIKEPVAIKAALGENPKSVYGGRHKSPVSRMAIAALLREELRRAKEYHMKCEQALLNHLEPVYDEKLEALRGVISKTIPLKVHAHREDDILTALRIAKEFDINIIIVHCTSGNLVKEILLKENASVMLGPMLIHRFRVEHKGLESSTPGVLSKMNIPVSIISDHPWLPTKYLSISASLAVREGMDEVEALKAITINPARMLGIEDHVGSIEVNKDADLIVMEGHPLDTRSRVVTTIINGKIVFQRNA
nr:amidohydrolase [uncultured Aminipila sp.]